MAAGRTASRGAWPSGVRGESSVASYLIYLIILSCDKMIDLSIYLSYRAVVVSVFPPLSNLAVRAGDNATPTAATEGVAWTHSGCRSYPHPATQTAMSDAQRASILRTLQASNIWTALRLPANTTADVVRQAFRRESRLLHPDKNPMPEAEAQASHSAATACTAGPARIRLGYTQLAWTRSLQPNAAGA